jgi:hypothetical protein
LPLTSFILARRGGAPAGRTPAEVLARAAAAPDRTYEPDGPDADERAAGLLGRGYTPGLVSQLMGQLGDVQAQLESEREKLARGA